MLPRKVSLLVMLIVVAVMVPAAPVSATVLWNGDGQTGDFSQWFSLQAIPGDAAVLSPPDGSPGLAARFAVHSGDDPINSTGERAETRASQEQTDGYEGHESWYGWSTYFPSDFNPPTGSWNIFTQFHETNADGCPPNIAFQADTSKSPTRIKVRVRGGSTALCKPSSDRIWRPATLMTDTWYRFVVHVRWSSDPAVGFVELWLNGQRVVPLTALATLYVGQGSYLKQGFYRSDSSLTSVIYHRGAKRGDSYNAVAP